METVKSSSYSKDSNSKKHSSSNRSSESKKKSSRHRHRDSSHSSSDDKDTKRKYDTESESDSDHKSSRRHKDSSKKHRSDEKSKSKLNTKNNKNEDSITSNSAGGDVSLSIEETNKLREKLGLKPLSLDENKSTSNENKRNGETGRKTYIDKDTNQEFEHAPAKNIADIREQKELREKLKEQKEKRQLVEKLRQAKGLADSDEEEDTSNWLIKLKQKEEAQKKAKLLEEMDKQFLEDDETPQRSRKSNIKQLNKNYTENDLSGLRVEHDQTMFKEGQEIILTLKDRNILKGTGDGADVDDEEDTLVNVNILDDERAKKNIENKKKKPDYQAFDEFDEDGMFKQKDILDKYNEELMGEKKKSFKLGSKGVYDASDDKFIERLNQEHRAKAIKIDALNELKLSNDYMTPQEMEKFKKPKKVRKVLRKNKMIKADDLLATAPEPIKSSVKSRIKKEETTDEFQIKQEPDEFTTKNKHKESNGKISLKDIDFNFNNGKSEDEDGEFKEEPDEEDDDDDIDVNRLKESEIEELKKVIEEENNVLDELHSVLSKTRQRVTSSILISNNLVKEELNEDGETQVVEFNSLKTLVDDDDNKKSLTLDSLSEFCRNLGTTSGLTRNEKKTIIEEEDEDEEEEEEMIVESKDKKDKDSSDDEDELLESAEVEMKNEDGEENEEDKEGFELLEEEPVIDRGLASCLKLAYNKGYIEQEKSKQNAKVIKASIEAINYTVEEKNYYDIDDKYNRNRDRYSGPLVDFQEKSNYKPDVKLDYIDEKGHSMSEKEAFRYLSHKFHGKGSGKKKTEKQQKKLKELEAMNKMSSIDTPLNTVALLVEKQKKLQQPFVVLSTSKKQDQVTLHKR